MTTVTIADNLNNLWKILKTYSGLLAVFISIFLIVSSTGQKSGANTAKIDYMQRSIENKADRDMVDRLFRELDNINMTMNFKLDRIGDKVDSANWRLERHMMKK